MNNKKDRIVLLAPGELELVAGGNGLLRQACVNACNCSSGKDLCKSVCKTVLQGTYKDAVFDLFAQQLIYVVGFIPGFSVGVINVALFVYTGRGIRWLYHQSVNLFWRVHAD